MYDKWLEIPNRPPSVEGRLTPLGQTPLDLHSMRPAELPSELRSAVLSNSAESRANMSATHLYSLNSLSRTLCPYLISGNSQQRGLHWYMIYGTLRRSHWCLETRLQTSFMEHVTTRTKLSVNVGLMTECTLCRRRNFNRCVGVAGIRHQGRPLI